MATRLMDAAVIMPATDTRLGFSDTDLEHGGSDRFLDAMVAWGDVGTIERRIEEHFSAGATHVCIQPVHEQGNIAEALEILQVLAPKP